MCLYGKCSKISNAFPFLFLNNDGNQSWKTQILVKIAKREDPDQTVSSEIAMLKICEHLPYLIYSQALKYLEIGTCPASQKLLANMEKMLIYIGNHPKFHLPCSLRHS